MPVFLTGTRQSLLVGLLYRGNNDGDFRRRQPGLTNRNYTTALQTTALQTTALQDSPTGQPYTRQPYRTALLTRQPYTYTV